MEFDRRRLISAAGGTLLLSLAPWQIASGAKLVNVRMWPAEEYTRVTIETRTSEVQALFRALGFAPEARDRH